MRDAVRAIEVEARGSTIASPLDLLVESTNDSGSSRSEETTEHKQGSTAPSDVKIIDNINNRNKQES